MTDEHVIYKPPVNYIRKLLEIVDRADVEIATRVYTESAGDKHIVMSFKRRTDGQRSRIAMIVGDERDLQSIFENMIDQMHDNIQ